ncbi:hypothetical protein MF271_19545 (plasmid) [Deinococcus sp. KNUC1210]|uniref:hypothetical protein n=1 Tax=Deinococcus sp. KNUC1210 TaxID=2917691 RepID=UPI001EF12238|nr:hypothetical protein [Deinococcus sp. KNUC1210]ULH17387.1 hypothetical protein MF271_19545 [Deinococcus sp. KNUC1210]
MTIPEPPLIESNVRKWLEQSTGSHWYFQPGWGIQYAKDGGLGLVIADGQETRPTVSDLDLMANSQRLGREWLALKTENKRLKQEAAAFRTHLDATVSELIERWCTSGSGMDGTDAAEALRDAMHGLAARLDAKKEQP